MNEERRGSLLLSTTEGFHGARNLTTVALGLKSVLDRVVAALDVSARGTLVPSPDWIDVALGVVSFRRRFTGILALVAGEPPAAVAAQSAPPSEKGSLPGKLLR